MKRPNSQKKPYLVCLCNSISKSKIEKSLDKGNQTLGEIFDSTSAGVGACGGSCRPQLEEMLNHYLKTKQHLKVLKQKERKDNQMPIEIFQLPAFEDNYLFVLKDLATTQVAVVDPGDAQVVSSFLDEQSWSLDFILNTHHHWDHVGGNLDLKSNTTVLSMGQNMTPTAFPDWITA